MKILGKFPNTRLRRVRNKDWSRRLISENNLTSDDLVYPIFIKEGKNQKEPIKSMPGVFRYSIDKVNKIVDDCLNSKIPMIALFPYTPDKKKDLLGNESLNEDNLVCRALRSIKKKK